MRKVNLNAPIFSKIGNVTLWDVNKTIIVNSFLFKMQGIMIIVVLPAHFKYLMSILNFLYDMGKITKLLSKAKEKPKEPLYRRKGKICQMFEKRQKRQSMGICLNIRSLFTNEWQIRLLFSSSFQTIAG